MFFSCLYFRKTDLLVLNKDWKTQKSSAVAGCQGMFDEGQPGALCPPCDLFSLAGYRTARRCRHHWSAVSKLQRSLAWQWLQKLHPGPFMVAKMLCLGKFFQNFLQNFWKKNSRLKNKVKWKPKRHHASVFGKLIVAVCLCFFRVCAGITRNPLGLESLLWKVFP